MLRHRPKRPDPGFVYLDANASQPLRPEARDAAVAALELTGNPASLHAAGRAARAVLEAAREQVAALFGAEPAGVVFTSGGTEANVLALAALGNGRRLLIGATEHDAVRRHALAQGAEVLPVGADGRLDLPALEQALGGPDALVCLMLANNETGILHPVREAVARCRARGALVHVDAVQAAGRLPVELQELGADSLAISGHKMGGPQGAGALLLTHARHHIPPLLAGGGQERGRRGGTPALPAIAGLAAAAAAAHRNLPDQTRLGALRDRIEDAAAAAGAVCIGREGPRLANTACLALEGRRSETQLIALDLAGYAVSAGSACSSGKVARSHVLEAMGLDALAGAAIRVSLPWDVTEQAVDGFIAAYQRLAGREGMAA